MKKEDLTKSVRTRYAEVAKQSDASAGSGAEAASKPSLCCGSANATKSREISKNIGYSETDLNSAPEGANLGLGCGNPVALASLKEGEVVLDLGSGAGFDCFIAASKVGPRGKIIGVDMTPEMLDRARDNIRKANHHNIEFRLGEIENLPVADNAVDVIISNCVINLSLDKPKVFREAFRVLKSGGRLMVSDIVLLVDLPKELVPSIEKYLGNMAGSIKKSDFLEAICAAGFKDVKVVEEAVFPIEEVLNDPAVKAGIEKAQATPAQIEKLASSVVHIEVSGIKL
jgi:arsenite methyltransferase